MDKSILTLKNLQKRLAILNGQFDAMTSAERLSDRGKKLSNKISSVEKQIEDLSKSSNKK